MLLIAPRAVALKLNGTMEIPAAPLQYVENCVAEFMGAQKVVALNLGTETH